MAKLWKGRRGKCQEGCHPFCSCCPHATQAMAGKSPLSWGTHDSTNMTLQSPRPHLSHGAGVGVNSSQLS